MKEKKKEPIVYNPVTKRYYTLQFPPKPHRQPRERRELGGWGIWCGGEKWEK